MKKITAVILIIAFVFTLASCTSRETAETALNNAITSVKELDEASMKKYLGGSITELAFTESNTNENFGDIIPLMTSNITYEIIEISEEGDTASAVVNITNINMEETMTRFVDELLMTILSYAMLPEEERPTNEELNTIYYEKFRETMEGEVTYTTAAVDVGMTYSNGWKIDITQEFLDALFGGFLSYTASLEESFSQIQN